MESLASKEVDLEREAEEPAHPQAARLLEECLEDQAAHSVPSPGRRDSDGPDLGQVLPHHVQRSTADELTPVRGASPLPGPHRFGHPELLDVLVKGDPLLREEDPLLRVGVHE